MKNLKKLFNSILVGMLTLSILIFGEIFLSEIKGAESRVRQEVIDKIEEKCVNNYPQRMLLELAMDINIKTKKGGFFPSSLDETKNVFGNFLKPGMKFLDLGSGDGRIVFFASLFGVEAAGIEYDPILYQISMKAREDLSSIIDVEKTCFIKGDFFQYDFSCYDIFYLYEGTDDMLGLKNKLSKEMKPGSILICDGTGPEIDNLILIREFSGKDDGHKTVYQKKH